MKILHVNDHADLAGGAETIIKNSITALESQSCENIVIHQHKAQRPFFERRRYQIDDLEDFNNINAVLEFKKIIAEEKPHLIHIYDMGNPAILEAAANSAAVVQSVFNHNFYCPGGLKYLPWQDRECHKPLGPGCIPAAFLTRCNSIRPQVLNTSYNRSLRMKKLGQSNLFCALSHDQVLRLRQSGWPSENVEVLPPYAIDAGAPVKAPGTGRILFAGRLFRCKGAHLLLDALTQIKRPWELVICGDGPELSNLKAGAAKLRIEDKIRFTPWLDSAGMDQAYRDSDVVALPSVWPEPFGMIGLEAMSHARPVVAFNVGGIPDWLEDGKNGFLVQPQDVKELARKIDILLKDAAEAGRMGRLGREIAETKFNRNIYLKNLNRIYEKAVAVFQKKG